MGYIIHELFHFLVGASLIYIITIKHNEKMARRTLVGLFGGAAAISPDVTKFFGDLLGHSIWFVPVFGIVFALTFQLVQKDISFIKSWGIFSLTVLIGHLFIDYIGNGVALFYPITGREFSLNIITSTDDFVLYTLLVVVLIGLFYRKGKMILLTGVLLIGLYLGGLTVSKYLLEQTLKEQYEEENISLLVTFRSHNLLEWNFMVRSDQVWVSGEASIFNQSLHILSEKAVEK